MLTLLLCFMGRGQLCSVRFCSLFDDEQDEMQFTVTASSVLHSALLQLYCGLEKCPLTTNLNFGAVVVAKPEILSTVRDRHSRQADRHGTLSPTRISTFLPVRNNVFPFEN